MTEKFGSDTGNDADMNTKTQQFYVDFETWTIEAVNLSDAWDIVRKQLGSGKVPLITNIEHVDLENCIDCGRLVEHYDDDNRCPQCSSTFSFKGGNPL